jgi:hypothetical protein
MLPLSAKALAGLHILVAEDTPVLQRLAVRGSHCGLIDFFVCCAAVSGWLRVFGHLIPQLVVAPCTSGFGRMHFLLMFSGKVFLVYIF